jgi:hypothetical protein
MGNLIVSEAARRIGAKPRDISTAFYERKLDDARCPIIGGRRLIPEDYLPEIAKTLREMGRLDGGGAVEAACAGAAR